MRLSYLQGRDRLTRQKIFDFESICISNRNIEIPVGSRTDINNSLPLGLYLARSDRGVELDIMYEKATVVQFWCFCILIEIDVEEIILNKVHVLSYTWRFGIFNV